MRVWDRLKERIEESQSGEGFERDPDFLMKVKPIFDTALAYFRADVRGGDNIPSAGPAILVGNHSGGMYTPEVYVLLGWWLNRQGPRRELWLLAHDLLLGLPFFGELARKVGCIHADATNARRALERGGVVVVFPGGEYEAFRPFWQRGEIDFSERTGFVKLALQTGAPIIPMVTHGSHDTTVVLSRGRRLARLIRLPRVRTKVFPWVLGLPWGLAPGFIPMLPLPARVTVQFLAPLRWEPREPDEIDDELVQMCFEQVLSPMRQTLRDLVVERPMPLLS